jgi:hypothetical protein
VDIHDGSLDDAAAGLATLDTPANAIVRAARTIDATPTSMLARARAHHAHSADFHREESFRIAESRESRAVPHTRTPG